MASSATRPVPSPAQRPTERAASCATHEHEQARAVRPKRPDDDRGHGLRPRRRPRPTASATAYGLGHGLRPRRRPRPTASATASATATAYGLGDGLGDGHGLRPRPRPTASATAYGLGDGHGLRPRRRPRPTASATVSATATVAGLERSRAAEPLDHEQARTASIHATSRPVAEPDHQSGLGAFVGATRNLRRRWLTRGRWHARGCGRPARLAGLSDGPGRRGR